MGVKTIFAIERGLFTGISASCASISIALILINLSDIAYPLRSPDVTGYQDFAGGETKPYEVSIKALEKLAASNMPTTELVTEATRVFHEGIAHIAPVDVHLLGLKHYRMRVPVSENWVLFLLSYVKPDTYRDYEFCNYRRALERGTGRCGQQSMALVSFLSELELDTGFIALEGHAVATVRVNESEWYILDSDYGGVIPFGIEVAERDPESVLPYYWSPAAAEAHIYRRYAPANFVRYGGPEARYARACPIESMAYWLKWIIPGLLLMPGVLWLSKRRQSAR